LISVGDAIKIIRMDRDPGIMSIVRIPPILLIVDIVVNIAPGQASRWLMHILEEAYRRIGFPTSCGTTGILIIPKVI
jgi:hypothetical protein